MYIRFNTSYKRHPLTFMLAIGVLFAQQLLSTLPSTPGLDVKAMDLSVQASENFYRYACGNWIRNSPIPTSIAGPYSKLTERTGDFCGGCCRRPR